MACGATSYRCYEEAVAAVMAVAAHDGCQHSSKARERDRYHDHAFVALRGPLVGASCREDQLAAEAELAVPEAEVVAVLEEVEFESYPFHHRRGARKHQGRSCRP